MGLVARELEGRGVATVCLSMLPEVAEKVKPPRTLLVPFGWGQPLGPPGRGDLHRGVATAALGMLEDEAGPAEIRTFAGGGGSRGDVRGRRPPGDGRSSSDGREGGGPDAPP